MKANNKKKSDVKLYILFAIILYISLAFFALHLSKVYNSEEMTIIDAFSPAMEHMQSTPLDIFPLNFKAIGIVSGITAFAGLFFVIDYQNKKKMRNGEEHGSADWNNDLNKYNKTYSYPKGKTTVDMSPGNKNMILSNDLCLSMDSRATMRNNNILIAGGSGSGKSRFEVKPNILQANSSYVITDPKGELLKSTGAFLQQQGYEIKLFNLIDFEHSNRYNPFKYIRNDDGVVMMVNTLIKNTNKKGSSGGDPFWEKSETALLQAICFFLYHECNPEDQTFSNVMRLLRLAEVREDQEDYKSPLDEMFEKLRAQEPDHIAVRQYDIFKMGAGKTLKSILISAAVRLTAFNMSSINALTTEDNLNLQELGDKKCALFVVIPDADDTFNFLVAIMYSQLFETLYYHADNETQNHRLDYPVRFLLDEFANIGEIPDFEKKLATMRSREISCTIIIQNLAQLKTMYKDSWESITGNCDTFIFLGGQEQSTLEYVSKKLGKQTITTRSSGRQRGKSGSSSTNLQSSARDLMTPDEIGCMENKNCIVFIRGIRPFFTEKYKYEKHPNYKYTEDANPKNIFKYKNLFITDSFEKQEDEELEQITTLDLEKDIENNDKSESERIKIETNRKPKEVSSSGKQLLVTESVTEETLLEKGIDINNEEEVAENISVIEEDEEDEFGGYEPSEDDFL